MKSALVDVPVLILFFNRPQQLSQVFEQVKKARPSRLFLYQDGARSERDLPGIEACREIVSQIDWECEVEQLYQEKNFGCDPSEYLSQKWAFSKVDKCIVLEDDDVPSVSFFQFCKEMLDKYEHDTRISMIAGFNPEEITQDMPSDYFFATTFSIWGWASWKRVVDQWDEFYSFLDDSFNMQQLEQLIKERKFRSDFIYMCQRHREQQKALYPVQLRTKHRAYPQHDKQPRSNGRFHPFRRLGPHPAQGLSPHLHHEALRGRLSAAASPLRH